MISITSAELNYIIFRYLHESGFTHSAFAFGYEAGINKSTIDGDLVPPGALVTFVQKGLQYLELEANLGNDETDVDEDFSFLQPLDLITKDAYELQRIVKEKKENLQKDKSEANGKEREREKEKEKEKEKAKEKEKETKQKEVQDRVREGDEKNEMEIEEQNDKDTVLKGSEEDKDKPKAEAEKSEDNAHVSHKESSSGPQPMEISTTPVCGPSEIPSSDVTILEGHTSEVFSCAWSSSGSLLASVAGDYTARIWTIPDGASTSATPSVAVLKHIKAKSNEKSKDVTTLDWNSDGTLLATGSYDGQARIWNRSGELRNVLNKHKGPIFSLKWNKKGDYLLSGSVDTTAIVWDIKTGECRQQFEFHTAPTLDVDWRNNLQFATCSTDTMIHVCKVGEKQPIKTFSGHQSEVNAIKWDPTGTFLASCSDDYTAKIWTMKQDKYVHDLREHIKEIYTIRWSPTGPGTNNPNKPLLLASASFDSTIKLWDAEQGRVLNRFNGHRDPVYAISFSPNGEYLASGSMDKSLHIWSLKEGKIIKTYTGNGGIFELCWNKDGNKVAVSFSNNIVCVVDFRM